MNECLEDKVLTKLLLFKGFLCRENDKSKPLQNSVTSKKHFSTSNLIDLYINKKYEFNCTSLINQLLQDSFNSNYFYDFNGEKLPILLVINSFSMVQRAK